VTLKSEFSTGFVRDRPPVLWTNRPWPVLAVAGLALEVFVFLLGFRLNRAVLPPALGLLVLHLLASSLVGFAFPGWRVRRGHTKAAMGPLVFALSFVFPVVGALSGSIISILQAFGKGGREDLLDEYRAMVDALLPGHFVPPDPGSKFVERSWEALELAPFIQIISSHTKGEVIASAFQGLSTLERPVACRLLRQALSSKVAVTRYYASSALARVEEELDREVQEAEGAWRDTPENPDTVMRLADARFAYSQMNGPDDPVVRFHLMECVRLYELSLDKVGPVAMDRGRDRLAQAHLLLGNAEEAHRRFDELIDGGSRSVPVFLGAIETSFRLRDLAGMRNRIDLALERCPDSKIIRRIADSWRREPSLPTAVPEQRNQTSL